jgi:hypothetical protein
MQEEQRNVLHQLALKVDQVEKTAAAMMQQD